MSSKQIGIMGGTFDPIHMGHLICAEQARESFELDEVLFMPTGRSAWKLDRDISSPQDRVAMTQLAISTNPSFSVSRIEVERAGVTYTADTLRALKEGYAKQAHLFFITGADAIKDVCAWHEARELARLATFVGVTRPGFDLEESEQQEAMEYGFDIRHLESPGVRISSTQIRALVADGRSIRYLVPDAVRDYILGHRLYATPPVC